MTLAFFLQAWLAGVSWGYATPILGVAPFGLAMSYYTTGVSSWFDRYGQPVIVGAALIAAIIIFSLIREHRVYRDADLSTLSVNLGDVFPKLSGIYTNEANFARYSDLKNLIEQYVYITQQPRNQKRPFVVLDDYPLIHFLTDTVSPAPLDWFYTPEVGPFEKVIWRKIVAANPVLIVAKEPYTPINSKTVPPPCIKIDPATAHPLTRRVVTAWTMIGESEFFCVFRSNKERKLRVNHLQKKR